MRRSVHNLFEFRHIKPLDGTEVPPPKVSFLWQKYSKNGRKTVEIIPPSNCKNDWKTGKITVFNKNSYDEKYQKTTIKTVRTRRFNS